MQGDIQPLLPFRENVASIQIIHTATCVSARKDVDIRSIGRRRKLLSRLAFRWPITWILTRWPKRFYRITDAACRNWGKPALSLASVGPFIDL
jgi:hypothetical protein